MWTGLDRHWKLAAKLAGGLAGGLGAADAVAVRTTSWFGLHATLGDAERDLLVAVAGAFGTLTGISFAVTAMIITFSDKPALDVYAETKDYPEIAPMMRHSNMALSIATIAAIGSLACLGRPAEAVATPIFLAVSAYAVLMLLVIMNRFSLMLDQVVARHQSAARKRAAEHAKAYGAEKPGELDDP